MRNAVLACGIFLTVLAVIFACATNSPSREPSSTTFGKIAGAGNDAYYTHHGDHLVPGDQLASLGRDIWIKATAGNSRFFAYVFPQRVSGKSIDWPDMLLSKNKLKRFKDYGLINDPDCCSPNSPDGARECAAKFPGEHIPETYGFDYCPGDRELLYAVTTKTAYRDPACDIKFDVAKELQAESPCALEFGTSTGTVGLRKFPNPRFDAKVWEESGGWDHYINRQPSGLVAVDDHAVEPPFRIGMACGHCHAALSPTNPPENPSYPTWANINTLIGNQYLMDGQIWGSGFRHDHVSSQSLAMSRPGTVDTSAVPNDFSGNMGTQNAIINLEFRPRSFAENVKAWRRQSCSPGKDCWCEPGKPGKCWKRETRAEEVPHILKGGEDSVGYDLAVQRVYFNIGSCSEQCWLNHLTDTAALDPAQRNYGQSPFDINQCRRDCANFRAIEDRVSAVARFFFSARPHDMKDVADSDPRAPHANGDREKLREWLETRASVGNRAGFGSGSVKRGATVFAARCASCHSSQEPPGGTPAGFASLGEGAEEFFMREVPEDAGKFLVAYPGRTIRKDWLGNDQPTPVDVVGTNSCRSRHSNHMKTSVYDEFASETYRTRNSVKLTKGPIASGGRGYYRNISLLNVWAHAPFLHNNAVGPELCGNPVKPKWSPGTYARYPDAKCWAFNPSFMGRFEVYLASMRELLTPSSQRPAKAMITKVPVKLELLPKFWRGSLEKGVDSITITFPTGLNSQKISSFRHKEFMADFSAFLVSSANPFGVLNKPTPKAFSDDLERRYPGKSAEIIQHFHETADAYVSATAHGETDLVLDKGRLNFYLDTYTNCAEDSGGVNGVFADNLGHDFGTGGPHDNGRALNEREKDDLIAFLAML